LNILFHRWIFLALVLFLGIRSPLWAALLFDLNVIGTPSGEVTRIHGSTGNGSKGVPVAGGYDCDGDGFVDTAFAGIQSSPLGRSGAGEVTLVFGDGTMGGVIDTTGFAGNILKIAGDQTREVAGAEIWIDDVTGDGLGDLLICRQNYSPSNRPGAGALTIMVGGPELRTQAETLQYLDLRDPTNAITLKTFYGVTNYDRLGIWVRTGDVTGDGIADIVVGSDEADGSGQSVSHNQGAIYVIRGGAHLATTQSIDLADFGSTSLTGHVARIHPPPGSADYHLGATCQIADLDGNGRGEVLAGATLNRAGAGIRLAGAPAGTGEAAGGAPDGVLYIAWDDNFPAGPWSNGYEFVISSSPGAHTMITGEAVNISFGEEIIGGLDYDGDGNAELFVGDLVGNGGNGNNSGLGHVFYNAAGLRGLSFDLDAPPTNVTFSRILGPLAGAIGADTVTQGDYDRDGLGDLVVGNPHDTPQGRGGAGSMHVLYGQNGGWPSTIDLSVANLPGAEVMRIARIDGAQAGDTLCYSAAAGDINGDGYTDIIVNEMTGDGFGGTPQNVGNLLLISGAALHRTRYVATNGTDGVNTCTNPAAPCATLQHALDEAFNADVIEVAVGAYTEPDIVVSNHLTIQGQGMESTIVQAATGPCMASNRVFTVLSNTTVLIENMTIRHGATTSGDSGGGLLNSGTLTLNNCMVRDNVTGNGSLVGSHGGGIFNSGMLTLNHSAIMGNATGDATNDIHDAPGYGGGIYNANGNVTLNACIVSNNMTGNALDSGGLGGGLYNYNGDMELNDSAICDNMTGTGGALGRGGDGGGIYNYAVSAPATLRLNHCTVCRNTTGSAGEGVASGSNGDGGGIYNRAIAAMAILNISNSTISCNLTDGGGSNSSDGSGGGIYNWAFASGAIAMTKLNHSTISSNHVGDGAGGGIYETIFGDVATSRVAIAHTILANNVVSSNGVGPDCFGTLISEGYNLIGDTNACTIVSNLTGNIINTSVLLGPLQDNGGPTETHALLPGSPAIDAGHTNVLSPPVTDQRGAPRVQNGVIDIGAFEVLEPDGDNDGIPGQWEFLNGLNPTNAADATADNDGDDTNNREEYIADTDPNDPDSFWRLTDLTIMSPAELFFESSTGRLYTLQYTEDLISQVWSNVPGQVEQLGNGSVDSLLDSSGATHRVYRVEVKAPSP